MFLLKKHNEKELFYQVGDSPITIIPYMAKALLDNQIINKEILRLCNDYRYKSYRLMEKYEYIYDDFLRNFPLEYEMELRKVIGILNIAFERRIVCGNDKNEKKIIEDIRLEVNKIIIRGWQSLYNLLKRFSGESIDVLQICPILSIGILQDGGQKEINDIPIILMMGSLLDINFLNTKYIYKYMEDSMVLYRLNKQDYTVFSKENFLKDVFLLEQCRRIRGKHFSYLVGKSLIDIYYGNIEGLPSVSTTMALTESELGFIGSKFNNKNLKIRTIDIDYLIAQYLMSIGAVEEKFKDGDKNKYFETISVNKSLIKEKELTETVISGLITNLLIKNIRDNREYHLENREEKLYYRVEELEEENEKLRQDMPSLKNTIKNLEFENKKLRNQYKKNLERENILLKSERDNLLEEINSLKDSLYSLEESIFKDDYKEAEDQYEEVEIGDINGIIIGGYSKLHREIEDEIPSLSFIETDNESYDTNILLNKDYIFIYTSHISHSLYYKTVNVCRAKKLDFFYINSSSVNSIKKDIRRAIEKKTSKK